MIAKVFFILGLLGQFFYFLRFAVQWYFSEKKKKVVMPLAFWVISICGAVFMLIYSAYKKDIIFILGSSLPLAIYVRNIILHKQEFKD